jgi:hypothetical protein
VSETNQLNAQYGIFTLSTSKAKTALRSARKLVERASEEIAR